jgi:photosystem II stability/assembly factor-like uncharacterized protein
MHKLTLLFLVWVAAAQAQGPRVEFSNTKESLRGVSAVSRQIAWASGTHGTYLRTTDAGVTWTPAQVPDAANLDFRAAVAFSADEAFLMSAGPGEQSRIYHTVDAGQHWDLQFTNTNPKGFFDSMVFWDPTHGVVLGDPIPDENGKLKFELLMTDDGKTWHELPPQQLPPAMEGEGAFAASNSCIAILHKKEGQREWKSGASAPSQPGEKEGDAAPDPNIWFVTGGKSARVFHSADRGKTWDVVDTPILHGPESAGIFSITFRDSTHGVIAGGDYKRPNDDGPNLAFTEDGGQTWKLWSIHPQAYFSAVAYDQRVNEEAIKQASKPNPKPRLAPTLPERIFIAAPDFIFDFRPPLNPRRINGKKKQNITFNALAPFPEGGALAVGPKGSIVFIP